VMYLELTIEDRFSIEDKDLPLLIFILFSVMTQLLVPVTHIFS
jgi:hypothetical protein